jgi:alpha-beta hydrolase superfamily lysophospholipase
LRTNGLYFRYAERLTPYYEEVALEGNKRGFLCFGHDHIGHGLSEGERVQIGDMSEYVDPVVTHCTAVAEKYPGLPLFLVGHSMGGLITLLTVLKTQVTLLLLYVKVDIIYMISRNQK